MTFKHSKIQHTIDITYLSLLVLTFLLFYAYVKQDLQFHPIFIFIFAYIGIVKWSYLKIKNNHGITRAGYLLPVIFFVLFTFTFTKVIKDQYGMKGGIDDKKWLVRHRKCFELLFLALGFYILIRLLQERYHNMDNEQQSKPNLFVDILSSLSTPMSICSGGACNSIYMSTVTSLLSSFSLPLTVIVPFLNFIAYCLQIVGLVSLYSVNGVKYFPFILYLLSMICQLYIQNWICGLGMLSAVIWNAKFNKFDFSKRKKKSIV